MRRSKAVRLGAAVAGLSLVLAACGDDDDDSGSSGDGGKKGGTFRMGITEPTAIDPYNTQESEGILVTNLLFDGLVANTTDGGVVNAVAEDRTTNDDCTQWTFKLKKDQKFSNGEAVDAQSFIRGWTRMVAKAAASDVAYHFAEVQGHKELNSGSAKTFTGLSSPDPLTLVVKLARPNCEFDAKTAHEAMSPVPTVAGGPKNKDFNDAPIGNGPFKMEGKWQHNQRITLVRNDQYSGTPANLDRVEITILNPENSADLEYQGFQADRFDWARMPTPQLSPAKARYEKDGKFIKQEANGMNYLLAVTDKGPMKSKEAREAVSWAIDRDAIIAGVFKGLYTKSTTLVAPTFEDFYQKGLCESCEKQDVEKAKALAGQAGLPPGTAVKLQFNTGAGHEEWVQAIGQQLEDVLGWKVSIDGIPFVELLERQKAVNASGLFRFAWGADFPTVDSFLFPLLHSDAINKDASGKVTGDNRSRYSNPQVDKLIDDARAETDPEKRIELQQEAERLALADLPLIPLWNRTQYRLAATDKFDNLEMDFHEHPTLTVASLK